MDRLLAGGVAGLAATVPMTAAMELMHRRLPPEEQYPLPPREITMNVAAKAGVHHKMDEEDRQGAALAAHFAFGTASGALYGLLAARGPGNPLLRGIGFGLAVWAGSYLGLLPATGLLSSAKHHPKERNALMIASHVVWGAATGMLAHALAGEERNSHSDRPEMES